MRIRELNLLSVSGDSKYSNMYSMSLFLSIAILRVQPKASGEPNHREQQFSQPATSPVASYRCSTQWATPKFRKLCDTIQKVQISSGVLPAAVQYMYFIYLMKNLCAYFDVNGRNGKGSTNANESTRTSMLLLGRTRQGYGTHALQLHR